MVAVCTRLAVVSVRCLCWHAGLEGVAPPALLVPRSCDDMDRVFGVVAAAAMKPQSTQWITAIDFSLGIPFNFYIFNMSLV